MNSLEVQSILSIRHVACSSSVNTCWVLEWGHILQVIIRELHSYCKKNDRHHTTYFDRTRDSHNKNEVKSNLMKFRSLYLYISLSIYLKHHQLALFTFCPTELVEHHIVIEAVQIILCHVELSIFDTLKYSHTKHMRITPPLLLRRTTLKMALHPPESSSKMICELYSSILPRDLTPLTSTTVAPTSSPSKTQADQFHIGVLSRCDLSPSPITQFHNWFRSTTTHNPPVPHPETCNLSTAHLPSGRVSSRFVYMKELDVRGFVVYSNWGTSKKARDVESNKWVALTFWWEQMERQVRVEGLAERVTSEEGQKYFDTRGRGSRIGAWASRQSQGIDDDRKELDKW